MLESKMFLGAKVSEEMSEALELLNPHVLKTFTDPEKPYLVDVTKEETRYLGKYVDPLSNSFTLDLLSDNIRSILQKLLHEKNIMLPALQLLTLIEPPKK